MGGVPSLTALSGDGLCVRAEEQRFGRVESTFHVPTKGRESVNEVGYLDPGSGGLMLQALVAGVASAAVMGKVYWRRAKRFLGFRREETPDE